MSTGWHCGKAFQMETGTSKVSKVSPVCRAVECREEKHLENKTGKVRSKHKVPCTESVSSCSLGSPPSSM